MLLPIFSFQCWMRLPEAWWWIKVDGADLVSGLGESVKGGGVDLADGTLKRARELHQQRLEHLGKNHHGDPLKIVEELSVAEQQAVQDVDFISTRKLINIVLKTRCKHYSFVINFIMRIKFFYSWFSTGLQKTSEKYSEKQVEGKSPEKTMFELA